MNFSPFTIRFSNIFLRFTNFSHENKNPLIQPSRTYCSNSSNRLFFQGFQEYRQLQTLSLQLDSRFSRKIIQSQDFDCLVYSSNLQIFSIPPKFFQKTRKRYIFFSQRFQSGRPTIVSKFQRFHSSCSQLFARFQRFHSSCSSKFLTIPSPALRASISASTNQSAVRPFPSFSVIPHKLPALPVPLFPIPLSPVQID